MMNAYMHRVWRKLQQREWKCNKRRFVCPNVSRCCISDALRVLTVKPCFYISCFVHRIFSFCTHFHLNGTPLCLETHAFSCKLGKEFFNRLEGFVNVYWFTQAKRLLGAVEGGEE